MYNWQNHEWPNFEYELSLQTQEKLYLYAKETSRLVGAMQQIAENAEDALLEILVLEGQKTSEIEGEIINAADIRSSLRQQIGLPNDDMPHDERAKGIATLLMKCRYSFEAPLTEEMVHQWHQMVMMGSYFKLTQIGCFRNNPDPMQIVSGPIGRERIYFEAPPSSRIVQEMRQFIEWFNQTAKEPGPIRAAIAHLYFESIHPYLDGNGRIGRALAEKALSQDLGFPVLYSLSNTLMEHRKQYYEMLHQNSQVSLEISTWIEFFVDQVYQAQLFAKQQVEFIIKKTQFWQKYAQTLNSRQSKVIKRMLAEGVNGFKGGMSTKKYISITDCSKATATRDLTELVARGCFLKRAGLGRNTSYDLCFCIANDDL